MDPFPDLTSQAGNWDSAADIYSHSHMSILTRQKKSSFPDAFQVKELGAVPDAQSEEMG